MAHPARSIESTLLAREQVAQIWESVGRLSAKQRTIFLLRFVDELELTEIAVATGISLPTVKSHLYRALDRVRTEQSQSCGKRERSERSEGGQTCLGADLCGLRPNNARGQSGKRSSYSGAPKGRVPRLLVTAVGSTPFS